MTRIIVKYCRRCGGTGAVARFFGKVTYRRCPRCSGSGGKTTDLTYKPKGDSRE